MMTEHEAIDRAEAVLREVRDPDRAARAVRKLVSPFCPPEGVLQWEARAREAARRNMNRRLARRR